jgi:hypothetical protein
MWQLLLRAQPHSVRLRMMLATRSTLGSTFARIILFWVEESICDFVIVVTRAWLLKNSIFVKTAKIWEIENVQENRESRL